MSTPTPALCGTEVWNLITDTWSTTNLYWACLAEIVTGGSVPQEYLNENLRKKTNKPITTEQYIKIFITVHNQFITEDQKRILKLAKVYPTYQEKKTINKDVKIALNEMKSNFLEEYPLDVKVSNVRIGLEKIIDHVKNNSKK